MWIFHKPSMAIKADVLEDKIENEEPETTTDVECLVWKFLMDTTENKREVRQVVDKIKAKLLSENKIIESKYTKFELWQQARQDGAAPE